MAIINKMELLSCDSDKCLRGWFLTLSILETIYFIVLTLIGHFYADLKTYHWYGPYIWWSFGIFLVFWNIGEIFCVVKNKDKWKKIWFSLQCVKTLVAIALLGYFIHLFYSLTDKEFHDRVVKTYFGDLMVQDFTV